LVWGLETAPTNVRQAIANKIIGLAKTGERNPDLLCEHALKDIHSSVAAEQETRAA
jgi:hypothetical protein